MRRLSYIVFSVCTLCSVLCTPVSAQDYARLSEQGIYGTARYMGFGGAMTAIGGDPSAVHDNPAGLGLYRRFEAMMSLEVNIDKTWQTATANKASYTTFRLPQASVVFSLPTPTLSDEGIQFHNLMLSYRRLNSFNRSYLAKGTNGVSLGALVDSPTIPWNIPFCTDLLNRTHQMKLRESGYVDEFAFDWSMNISNQWYIGVGLGVQSYLLNSSGDYYETFDSTNVAGEYYDIENETGLILKGISCNFSLGLIYRPTKWLRLGLSMHTPSFGVLRTYTSGTFSARTDSVRFSYAPNLTSVDRSFRLPWRTSASIAFQCGAYGMLAFQYDFAHGNHRDDVHTLKAGLEVIPVMGLYINAGYAYESTFKKTYTPAAMDPTFDRQDTYSICPKWSQYASVAVGYRGTYFMVQAAYQFRWQNNLLYAHEWAEPYDMTTNTHRIVITLGWHQY